MMVVSVEFDELLRTLSEMLCGKEETGNMKTG